jgi:hypothetical protein
MTATKPKMWSRTQSSLSAAVSQVSLVVGTANGTPGRQPDSLRVGVGSGVCGLGSPRVIEFSLKLIFCARV